MIGIFKQKAPGNVALLLILGLLLKLPLFLYPKYVPPTPADGRLYAVFTSWINSTGLPFLSGVISFLLLYIQALIITGIVNEYRMTSRSNFLPGMAYILITSLLPEWSILSAPLFAVTFLLWAFAKLFELYNDTSANSRIYNIGLLVGIASFFYFPALLFFPCMLIGMLILRPFRLNEIFLLLIGATTPYYFYAVYLFLADGLTLGKIIPALKIYIPGLSNSLWLVGSTVLLTIPFLVGGYYIQTYLRKMLIQARKNWSIALLWLFFALLIAFVNPSDGFTNWVIAVGPFAAFHACSYFYPTRNSMPLLLFFITIAFILVQQYGTNAWQ